MRHADYDSGYLAVLVVRQKVEQQALDVFEVEVLRLSQIEIRHPGVEVDEPFRHARECTQR